MKVVVVGGAGNVGRLFATHLRALGAEVVRVDAAGGEGVERVDVLKTGGAAGRCAAPDRRRRCADFFASLSETS